MNALADIARENYNRLSPQRGRAVFVRPAEETKRVLRFDAALSGRE